MLSERAYSTVHVETSLSAEDLRDIVAPCGDIRGVYAAGATHSRCRYYVEFSDRKAAQQAGALQIPDTAIDILEASPHLADHFQTIVTLPPKPHADVLESARTSPYRKVLNRKVRRGGQTGATVRDKHQHRVSTCTVLGPPPSPVSRSTRVGPDLVAVPQPLTFSFDKENHAQLNSWRDRSSPSSGRLQGPSTLMPAYYTQSDSDQSLPSSSSFANLETCSFDMSNGFTVPGISPLLDVNPPCLPYGDDLVPIDLENLDNNPNEVIAFLKAAANQPYDCAKWMVVGAHYRRRDNFEAAIAVITLMIQVMLDAGMEASQLKPAMLMLASCHLDVARRLRAHDGIQTAESRYHLDQACEGFRKVYGTFEAPTLSASVEDSGGGSAGMLRTRTLTSRSNVQNTPAKPLSLPKPSLDHTQLSILEREVQSLRDREERQLDQLNCARSAKRKLEDELDKEQYRRRRVEMQLAKVEKTVSGAQRGEEFALEQCRVEVETRRRAEERLHEIQGRIEVVEPRIAECEERERKMREYFGKLGVAFLKAARGDMGDVPSSIRV